MNLLIQSYNGHSIQDSTFKTIIPPTAILTATNTPILINRMENFPSFAGITLSGRTFALTVAISGNLLQGFDTLKSYCDTTDPELRVLIAYDVDNANKSWYLLCKPTSVSPPSGNVVTVTFSVPNPIWQSSTEYSQAWNVVGTSGSTTVQTLGNYPALPVFEITPLTSSGSNFAYQRFVTIYNKTSNLFTKYPIDVTGGGMDTAALVTAGKAQADGDDYQVFVDGVRVNRWFSAFNDAATTCWVNLDLKAKKEFSLKTAIPASGAIGDIEFKPIAAAKKAIKTLSNKGILLIDSELFTYDGVNITLCKVGNVTRATKGTSEDGHSANATIRFIEHDIWIVYGNPGEPAPTIDDTVKPIIDLSTSTNESWVYAEFSDAAALRSGIWAGTVQRSTGKQSDIYTGNQLAEADPATEMGAVMNSWQKGTKWQSENAIIIWSLSHPAGVATVTFTGEKYRYSTAFPTLAALQYQAATKAWATSVNETSPALAQTWTAFTQTNKSTGNRFNIRFIFSGSINAYASNYAAFAIESATLALTSANVPSITVAAETGNYQLDAKIENDTTSQLVEFDYPMLPNKTLTFDTNNKIVDYEGTNAFSAFSLDDVRRDWLNITSGSGNILLWTSTTSGSVTVNVKWRDRML